MHIERTTKRAKMRRCWRLNGTADQGVDAEDATGFFTRRPARRRDRGENQTQPAYAALRTQLREAISACTTRARRPRYAVAAAGALRASCARRGGVDRDREEPRYAASRQRQGDRWRDCGGWLCRCWSAAHARSPLGPRTAAHGRASGSVCLRAYWLPPVQSRSGAHLAKPLPSCCSLRGAATGYLKCVYRPR